ncbi:MAG: hypothetical protein ACPGQV_07350 [Alphaproteobacteria bacterium]
METMTVISNSRPRTSALGGYNEHISEERVLAAGTAGTDGIVGDIDWRGFFNPTLG